ncbi:uncharacterized protein LOC121709299 [Alosa sapidissima]|uniref:uncharacterized protein LOC121709299 n=1 Tax=Alosa sapidissima TaxID=34773 RepID=UPI001C08CDD6|nr:uncharacterized protein LOC121709299 [Alosa sapidissima]
MLRKKNHRKSLTTKEQWRLRKEKAKYAKCDETDTSETSDHISCEETHKASLRVSHSQPDLSYSEDGRGSQCLASSLMFLAYLQEAGEVDRRNLDDVMRKGDLLYHRMRHQLEEDERSISKNLSIDDLPDTVDTDHDHYRVVRSIPMSGLLEQDAPQDQEDCLNLSLHLEGLGTAYSQALLMVGTLCISVFQDRHGPFGFFYPLSQNANESCSEEMEDAVVVTFNTVTDLANGLVQFCTSLGLDANKEYNLLPVVFMSIRAISEEDHIKAGSAMESKQKSVAQNSASQVLVSSSLELKIRRVSVRLTRLPKNLDGLKDRNALDSVWPTTDTEREGHLHSSEKNPSLEKIRRGSGKLTRRQEKLKELKERNKLKGTQHKTDAEREGPLYSSEKKSAFTSQYRNDPAFRRVKLQRNRKNNPSLYKAKKQRNRDRYRLDGDFREKQKQYSRDRYKNDPMVREKHRQRSKEMYQNNPVYREKLKQRSRDVYLNDPVHREKLKQRSRDVYQNDPVYRLKQKEYVRLRYQRKVTEKASQILSGGRNEEC